MVFILIIGMHGFSAKLREKPVIAVIAVTGSMAPGDLCGHSVPSLNLGRRISSGVPAR